MSVAKERSFLRRHKLAVGAAAIGVLFVMLPEHRRTLTMILLTGLAVFVAVIGLVLIIGASTPPGTSTPPTVAPQAPVSSCEWGALC